MPWLATGLPSTDHPLALGMGFDTRTIRRRGLAAIAAGHVQFGAQCRVLRPQRRVLALHARHTRCHGFQLGRKLAHQNDHERDDGVGTVLIGVHHLRM